MNYQECLEFMKKKHGDQKRKQGTPFYEHPLAVANILKDKGFGLDYQIAALFHDLLEDTDTLEEEIINLSNKDILNAVKLVTKEKNYNKEEYINRIKNNEMAHMVKLADRLHNLTDSFNTDKNFITKYVNESIIYYVPLAKDTVFEDDINNIIEKLKGLI